MTREEHKENYLLKLSSAAKVFFLSQPIELQQFDIDKDYDYCIQQENIKDKDCKEYLIDFVFSATVFKYKG